MLHKLYAKQLRQLEEVMGLIDESVSVFSMKLPFNLKILMLYKFRLGAIIKRSCASAGYRETFAAFTFE